MDQDPIDSAPLDDGVSASPSEAAVDNQGDGQGEKSGRRWVSLVIFGILVTIVAWIAMVYNEYVSFGASVVGLICSVSGAILVGKGTWRSLSITSAIAAGVLFLVFVMLWAALSMI